MEAHIKLGCIFTTNERICEMIFVLPKLFKKL